MSIQCVIARNMLRRSTQHYVLDMISTLLDREWVDLMILLMSTKQGLRGQAPLSLRCEPRQQDLPYFHSCWDRWG